MKKWSVARGIAKTHTHTHTPNVSVSRRAVLNLRSKRSLEARRLIETMCCGRDTLMKEMRSYE